MQLVQDLALIMTAAAVATVICQRLNQPVVLGYILAGVVIGPNNPWIRLVVNEEEIRTLAELGVILLMFSVGLHFSFRKLKEVGGVAIVTAVVEIAGMFFLGERMGRLFGWSTMDAIFLGAILSISSTTIIAKVLESMGLLRPGFARLIFGVLIVEDILAIAMMGMLTSFGTTGELSWLGAGQTLLKLAAFFVAVAVGGFLLVPGLVRLASRTRMEEVLLITVLGLIFAGAIFAERLGFSVALGAFLIGAVLAEVKEVNRIEKLVAPVRDLFSAIFFTSSGMLITFAMTPRGVAEVGLIALVVVIGKIIFSTFGALLGGADLRTAVRAGMSLAQIGEFSFILAGLGMSLGVTGQRLYSLAVMVSAVTTLTTPYLIRVSEGSADWMERKAPRWWVDFWRFYPSWLRSMRSEPGDRHHVARQFIRKLLGQLGLQLALLTAPILAAAAFWDSYRERLPETVRLAWWGGGLFWLGGALLALPVGWAFLRKYHALAMLVSELIFPRGSREEVGSARKWATFLFCGMGAVLGGVYLLVISSPLLPSGKMFPILMALVVAVGLVSRKKLVELYAKGQSAIRDTFAVAPDPGEVRLPGDSQVRSFRVGRGSGLIGQSLKETGLRKVSGVVVVAIERAGGSTVSPGPDERLFEGDELFVFGEKGQLELASEFFMNCGVVEV
ncbi:MAG: cation:proton antiporter [Candidatus Pacebacteria bacterium]|jgi:CPA2 family monovalent cation:H+ antiporter-2|nr:cation:proton antiporter [Candidatus Paceibacterota bacterium]